MPVERVKLLSCRSATKAFRPYDTTRTLACMLVAGEGDIRPLTGAHETMRAELLHEPYFRALAALEGHENGGEWRALIAGLVTLRLADWRVSSPKDDVRQGPRLTAKSGFSPDVPPDVIEAAQSAVAAVDEQNPVSASLRELVRSAASVPAADLPERLLAYAHALHADSRWLLAADVFRTVLRMAASPYNAREAAVQAFVPRTYDRLGRSLRMIGDLDGASAAYDMGGQAAQLLGDRYAERLMRISRAKILMHLGNLPAAAAALDAIIRDETASRDDDCKPSRRRRSVSASARAEILALARHDRGLIATLQHEFTVAAEQYFAAWQGYRDPDRRERVWVDLALNFAEMGQQDVAREAFLVLYTTARWREVRFIAAANLIELAVLAGREELFEQYRRVLRQAELSGVLPAEVAAKFAFYEGRGEARFGRPDNARLSFERALAIATRHRVNEVTIRADEAIAALRAGRPIADWSAQSGPTYVTASVKRIARAVRRARRSTTAASS